MGREEADMEGRCGCGRVERYMGLGDDGEQRGACNKYGRCPSWDELDKRVKDLSFALMSYKHSVDQVMDVIMKEFGKRNMPEVLENWMTEADQKVDSVLGLNNEKITETMNTVKW